MLGELYVRRRRSLVALLTRIVRNPHTAEDLAQEAFLRVGRAAEAGSIVNLDAFLHRTARNLGLDHERQRLRRARFEGEAPASLADVPEALPPPEERLIERERQAALRRTVAALPERARRAWHLAYVEGHTYAQIAETLGVSRNTVYNDVKLVIGHCHDTLRRHGQG